MLPRTSQARKRAKEHGNAYVGCPLPCSSQGALRASKLLSQGLPCTQGQKGWFFVSVSRFWLYFITSLDSCVHKESNTHQERSLLFEYSLAP